jgi:pre-mRNA-splicing factor SYF1
VYCVYLQKTEEYFGVVATRPVYEKALAAVPDDKVRHISLRFAEMERQLGELDRARAIFVHGSQTCDPKRHGDFWGAWREFELQHGNEVTFKDMLQVKRTIQSRFATATYSAAADEAAAATKKKQLEEERLKKEDLAQVILQGSGGGSSSGGGLKRKAEALGDEGEQLQQQTKRSRDNIAASIAASIAAGISVSSGGPARGSDDDDDDDEIDIDDDDDEEEGGGQSVQQKSVPSAVFGGLQ